MYRRRVPNERVKPDLALKRRGTLPPAGAHCLIENVTEQLRAESGLAPLDRAGGAMAAATAVARLGLRTSVDMAGKCRPLPEF